MEATTTDRAQHLQWCKDRALAYIDRGDTQEAFTSMASDLDQHESTRGHKAIQLGFMLLLTGSLSDPARMRDFINGFN